jgi:eukaryotic-like serine/threonine-protein kinase
MDSALWERIQSLFHGAADLPEGERDAFLQAACGADTALLTEILAMIEEDEQGKSLLDSDVAHLAAHVLDDPWQISANSKDFGPYIIKSVLGEGGMGVVYLAERRDLGNLVAIKVLRDAWLSPARRERFASEQKTLALLVHSSIARLYDANTLPDGTPWFVMEYVEGLPLTDYCEKYNCLIARRLELFRQVCEAVQYAHQHAVIHRDLKPSNILVEKDGGARLLDFGISKQLEGFDAPKFQTRTVLRLMTPAYASPEQIRGDQVGVHTDVYSLGTILYELLTGKLPFDLSGLSPGEAATVIVAHEPGKPSSVVRRMPKAPGDAKSLGESAWADLDVLCLTAMHKDPARRYRSVEALLRDIDHYLKDEPLEARPDAITYRVSKFVGRNRRAVAATALVLTAVVGLVIFFTVRLAKARDAALAEAARTERIQQFMTNLFQGGDESVGPSDEMRVVTLLDRGVQEAQNLKTDPKIQAELLYNLGGIYEQLGKLDKADHLQSSALEQRKALFGPDSAEVAESLVALGGVRSDQAQYHEAEKLIRRGLEMSRRRLSPNHPAVGKALYALGALKVDRGDYDEAIQVLNQAVNIQSAPGGVPADLAMSLTSLANSHFYLGHYDISKSLNQRVLAMDRQLYGDRHPNVAEDYINLAAIEFERTNYKGAEQLDRQALDIMQSFYTKNHPETASVMTLTARALVAEGQLSEAADMLRDALGVEEGIYKQAHPRIASTLNELGKIAQKQGKFDEAEMDFRREADIYRKVYDGKHYYIGVALSNQAGVYVDKKRYDQAERLFREALQMYSKTLPANHQLVGIAQVRLGDALAHQRHYAEAELESRAGYENLTQQTNPPANWLQDARQDLIEDYAALKQPEKAAKLQAEMASIAVKPAGPAGGK